LGQSASKPTPPVSEALASPTILNVVSPLNLSRSEADSLTEELRWLFSAADNLLAIHNKLETEGFLDRSQPIAVSLPLQAQLTIPDANNQLLSQPPPAIARIYTTVEEALQYSWAGDVRGELRDLKVHLNALSTLLSREASQGESAKKDAALQNNITGNRILVVEKLTTIAKTINQAYGVLVSAPDRLLAHLEQRDFETEPTVWGGLIISTVFAAFDLDAEDRSFVEDELRWLLSAAANLLAIARRLKTEGVLDPSQPIAAPTPAGAELTVPEADNRLLQQPAALSSQTHGYQTVAEILQQEWQGETQGELHNLSIYLNNLKIMLDRAAELGQAGQVGFALQDKIKKSRLAVVAALQSLAGTMAEAYGISVSSPTQLLEFLAD
jgi:hypothetical protein